MDSKTEILINRAKTQLRRIRKNHGGSLLLDTDLAELDKTIKELEVVLK